MRMTRSMHDGDGQDQHHDPNESSDHTTVR